MEPIGVKVPTGVGDFSIVLVDLVAPKEGEQAQGADFAIDTAQAGYLRMRIAVGGRGLYTPFVARGTGMQDNSNPYEKAAHVVVALEQWARAYQERERFEYWGGTIVPTAQVQELRASGPLFTEAEEYCYIYFDIRLRPGGNPLDIQQQIRSVADGLGIECEVTAYDYNRGYIAEGAESLIEAITNAHAQIVGSDLNPPAPPFVSMWRDMNAFNEVGIPSISYGPPSRPETYTMGGYSSVSIADLLCVAKVYALTAASICGITE